MNAEEIQTSVSQVSRKVSRYPAAPLWKITPLHDHPAPSEMRLMDTPAGVASYWRDVIEQSPSFSREVETFYVIFLNTRRRCMGAVLVASGTVDSLLVHPREVFRLAIMASASAIVLAHNHPSGDPTPSEADIRTTRDLIHGGKVLKLEVLDHVIIGVPDHGSKGWSSLRELGHFCN